METQSLSKNDLSLLNRTTDRRRFLRGTKAAGLSGVAIALMGSSEVIARGLSGDVAADVTILNAALSAEREAVAAYQVGAESGLLSKGVLSIALGFQGHHKEHRDVLVSTIGKLGGAVKDAPAFYNFPVEKLKNERDVLMFAAGLEKGAVSAYLGAVPLFNNRDLAAAAASILGDEAMHWAVLRGALGLDPVPAAFMS